MVVGLGVYICLLLLANYLIKNEKFYIIHTMFTIIFICFSQIPLIYFAKLEGLKCHCIGIWIDIYNTDECIDVPTSDL